MDDLLTAIAHLALELHPDRISSLAAKIETLGSSEGFELTRPSFGPNVDKRLVDQLGRAWRTNSGTSPSYIASALRGASAAATLQRNQTTIQLVWTGPSTGEVPVRHTEQALCEVIDSAESDLFLVSFVAYDVDSIIRAMRNAIDRQVRINVLLESSEDHGGRLTFDSVDTIKSLLPSIDVYVRVNEHSPTAHPYGAVHAKCAVADGQKAFITSANLTSAAMERNMELGVLITGGDIPSELHRHLDALITTRIIEKVNEDRSSS